MRENQVKCKKCLTGTIFLAYFAFSSKKSITFAVQQVKKRKRRRNEPNIRLSRLRHKILQMALQLSFVFPVARLRGFSLFIKVNDMQQNLNVPKQLVQRYATTKRRKELLCFAIWLKMRHENSVVWGMNHRQVRYQLGVGRAKAMRLLSDAGEDGLFDIKGETITVRSFRDRTIKYGRRGVYRSDFCFKFPCKENYTLRELYNLMNEFLATDSINAYERKTAYLASQRGAAITLKSIARNTRMSWSATRGIVNRLKDKGILNIGAARIYCFLMAEELEAEAYGFLRRHGLSRFTFWRGMDAYVVFPRTYSIASREWSERFKHVIWGYDSGAHTKEVKNLKDFDMRETSPQWMGY